ncbi:MAG: hypothetical protein C0603_01960 [Denitrovibrio sp.]|nr:MAG: hypothetical protein C0603_01960 [Denitrovibrio sp.]
MGDWGYTPAEMVNLLSDTYNLTMENDYSVLRITGPLSLSNHNNVRFKTNTMSVADQFAIKFNSRLSFILDENMSILSTEYMYLSCYIPDDNNRPGATVRLSAICEVERGASACDSLNNTNTPPTISGTPVTQITAESDYSFTPTSDDAENDSLTFSITNKPSWALFDTTTGELSGTPTNSNVGTTSDVTISVTDGEYTVSLTAFDVTVNYYNSPPQISGTPSTDVTADSAYNFVPTASDADSDVMTFSIVNKPSWASFNTSNGTLSGTPTNADTGTTNDVTISVTDGTDTVALAAYNITVNYHNSPPTISGTPTAGIVYGNAYSFTPTSNDADGDGLTFSIANNPSWATLNPGTGALTGTPTAAESGYYPNIVISVTDGTDTTDLTAFSIGVFFPVYKTGQTVVYQANDDGTYQAGQAMNYTRASDIVTDNNSGMMYQDDAGTAARLMTLADGINYCDILSLGGYDDWRLPTPLEFIYATDYTQSSRVLEGTFLNEGNGSVFTNQEDANNTAMQIVFQHGEGYYVQDAKTDTNNIRCVRGGLPTGNFVRDDSSDTVTDYTTGLMWQDDLAAAGSVADFQTSLDTCEALTLGDFTNWRVPNIKEATTIYNNSVTSPSVQSVFQNIPGSAVKTNTSTAYAVSTSAVHSLAQYYGYSGVNMKNATSGLRCVRTTY